MDYKSAEQKHIDEAMQDIRQAMHNSAMPNADILELTDRVEDSGFTKEELFAKDELEHLQEVIGIRKSSGMSSLKSENNNFSKEELLEFLKPHVNSWLDENLHAVVRKAVEDEVKKLVSQG